MVTKTSPLPRGAGITRTTELPKDAYQYDKPIGPKPPTSAQREKQWRKDDAEQRRIEKEEKKERNRKEWEEKREREKNEREDRKRKEQSETATREAERIADRQSTEEWKEIQKKNAGKKPYEPKDPITVKSIAKTVGNVIVSGVKKIPVNEKNPGRSGRRASLEYRRANREYNSEARRMRSQVTPLSSFSAGLLGANSPPVRSKYGGTMETGAIDPLSNWSSGIMGAGKVRQDSTMEGVASRMAGRKNPGRKPKPSSGDPLVGLNKMLRGGR